MARWFESKCRMRLSRRRFLRHARMPILFVADLFHPLDDLPIEALLNGDVRHRCGRCGPVPVLLAGRKPGHITGPDLLDRSAVALNPTVASRDDESLTERMRKPLQCVRRARKLHWHLNMCRIGCLEKRINPYGSREPL
jgi:hypothetical protein